MQATPGLGQREGEVRSPPGVDEGSGAACMEKVWQGRRGRARKWGAMVTLSGSATAVVWQARQFTRKDQGLLADRWPTQLSASADNVRIVQVEAGKHEAARYSKTHDRSWRRFGGHFGGGVKVPRGREGSGRRNLCKPCTSASDMRATHQTRICVRVGWAGACRRERAAKMGGEQQQRRAWGEGREGDEGRP